MRRVVAGLGVLGVVIAGTWTSPGPAAAIDQGKGQAGYCTTDRGVTVVVDFGELGGKILVRCHLESTRGTGLDALKGAGFQINGVQRWGESFICRIENRPSAVEALPINGNAGYRESCIDTPPAAGYWAYWTAGNSCAWKYSQSGIKNRDFVPGGFEGWRFALNTAADDAPEPRVAAVRPGTSGQPCSNGEQAGTSAPDDVRPGTVEGSGDTSAGAGLPAPKPRPATTEGAPHTAAGTPVITGGEDDPDVTETIDEQAGSSSYAPWAAGGVLVLLGLTTGWSARRRRRARTA